VLLSRVSLVLSVVKLSVVMLNVARMRVVVPSALRPSVIMLSVVVPQCQTHFETDLLSSLKHFVFVFISISCLLSFLNLIHIFCKL
jgi:hypothetical protein